MNREIKFRGKVKYNGNHKFSEDWIYGYYRNNDNGNAFITETLDDYSNYIFDETEVDESTIGQYTGLKDKNGVEIYEGDIVSEKGHYVNSDKLVYQKIQWKENYSCWLRGEYQRLTPKNIKIYDIEVVGNIYDNPELIEKEGKVNE